MADETNLRFEEKMVSGVTHMGILFGIPGLLATILVRWYYKSRSPFVFEHANQAMRWQIGAFLLKAVYGFFTGGLVGVLVISGAWYHPLQWVVRAALDPQFPLHAALLGVAFWVMFFLALQGLAKSFGGHRHRYPLVGRKAA